LSRLHQGLSYGSPNVGVKAEESYKQSYFSPSQQQITGVNEYNLQRDSGAYSEYEKKT